MYKNRLDINRPKRSILLFHQSKAKRSQSSMVILSLLIGWITTGCSSLVNTSMTGTLTQNYCIPNISYETDIIHNDIGSADSLLIAQQLSAHDFALCRNLNMVPYILRYISAQDDLQIIMAKQEIVDQHLLFSTELEAIAAELDCNGERIEQLANYLDNLNAKTESRLTVASIVLGAATAVAATFTENNNFNNSLSIVGGIGSAGLGFMTLRPKGKKVHMNNDRNMLSSIWYEQNIDSIYPPSIWRILSEKEFSNSKNRSLLETTKVRWMQYGLDDEIDVKLKQLYFQNGGIYTAEELHTFANMHNELQATVRSIQQDLRSLMQRINKLKNLPSTENNGQGII